MNLPRPAEPPEGPFSPRPGTNDTGNWAAAPERSRLWVMLLMRWIALHAGRRATRWLLHPIALYFLLTGGRVRRASVQYLGRVLGRPAGWRDAYRHIHHFAATLLDRVYFLQERFDCFEVTSHGVPMVDARLARGEGCFMVGAHMGSFEALRALGQERGRRVAMVMYQDNARLINTTLAALAPRARLHTIALGRMGAMLALREWLESGGIAGLLADRTLPGPAARSKTLWLPFLGQPAPFSDGPFRLAAMLRRPVIFMVGLYHGGPRYELRLIPLADFSGGGDAAQLESRIHDALQRYVLQLEALCRETPYNWFNFFDFWADDAATAPTRSATPPGAGSP